MRFKRALGYGLFSCLFVGGAVWEFASPTAAATADNAAANSTGAKVADTSARESAAKIDQLLKDEMAGEAAGQKASSSAAQKPAKPAGAYPSDESNSANTSVAAYPKSHPAGTPAQLSDDETFLRRATMDLVGHPPSPKDITAFALDPSPDKRAKAVDRLLAHSDFGENWARYWRDVIMYRKADDRAMLVAPTIEAYLAEQFNKNTSWDEIARSFITATGDVQENGATGIIFAQAGESVDVTAEVSRIFMGVQIQCAQCHDHPTDRWKRTQFHELAAFFPRVGIQAAKPPAGAKQRSFVVYGNDKARSVKKKNNQPQPSAEHYMPDLKNPTAEGTKMSPVFFVTGQKLTEGTPDGERRKSIARWITSPQDPWFAKAFVNRVWSELVGEGFYEPVDDIGPDRDCNAPATLDYLASQFITHNYDIKWLYRTVMATAAYQRDSRSRHLPGEAPFLANCPQRLRADELFDALMLALGSENQPAAADKNAGGKKRYQPRTPRGAFDFVFGYDPSVRRDDITGSIPQALVLMNSPQLARGINGRSNTALAQLLSSTKDDQAVVEELYLRTLAREPKPAELKTCLEHVKKTSDRSEAFEDVLWALINSTEFLHRK